MNLGAIAKTCLTSLLIMATSLLAPQALEGAQSVAKSQLDPERAHALKVPANHLYVIKGHLFVEGQDIVFKYDRESRRLFANNQVIVNYNPRPNFDTSVESRWTRAFVGAFMSTDTDQLDSTRARHALGLIDNSGLDSSHEPEISSHGLTVWFAGQGYPVEVMYPMPAPSPEVFQRDAMGYIKNMMTYASQEPGLFVWFHGRNQIKSYSGEMAERARDFFFRVAARTVDLELLDSATAEELGITREDIDEIRSVQSDGVLVR